jgi:hypothetical protein
VALIDETAGKRNFRKLKVGPVHKLFCALDTFHRKPCVRRRAGRLLERLGKVAARQATFGCNIRY